MDASVRPSVAGHVKSKYLQYTHNRHTIYTQYTHNIHIIYTQYTHNIHTMTALNNSITHII